MLRLSGARPRAGWLGALSGALAVLVLTLGGSASGDIFPVGCNVNAGNVTVSRPMASVERGDTIPFTVNVTNLPAGDACEVINGDVNLTLPDDTTGLATGTVIHIATGQTYPSGSTTSYGPFDYVVPTNFAAVPARVTAMAHVTGDVRYFDAGYDTLDKEGTATTNVVDGSIAIAPDATNEVGQPHTFTVTVKKDTGSGVLQPADGLAPGAVTVSLADSDGATSSVTNDTCASAGTDANGQCAVTFSSPTTGKVTGNASVTCVLGSCGLSITRDTDPATVDIGAGPGGSGPAVKTFVDANIQITPDATNIVGQTHVFTAHVNVDDGSGGGFVSAPDGTQISFTLDSGPGSFTTVNPCTTAGGTGSCQISLTSAVTGVSVVSAHSTPTVGGVALTRDTDGVGANSPPAEKTWVDAKIEITPDATNVAGSTHVFHVTVSGVGGKIDAGTYTVTGSKVSGVGDFVPGFGSCQFTVAAGGAASGTCDLKVTSAAVGSTVVSAASTVDVEGQSITRETDTTHGSSGPATKKWVDAYISISPAAATNPVGTPHVLTITVHGLNGNVGAGTATATILSGPGSPVSQTCDYAAGGTSSSCTVTITSSTPGISVVQASSSISVAGQPGLTRTTGTQVNTDLGGSGNAGKLWIVTFVRDAGNNDVTNTAIPAGSVVHDEFAADGSLQGVTVQFDLYANGTCNTGGAPLQTSWGMINPSGTAISADTAPLAPGSYSYLVSFPGGGGFPAGTAACEPFEVLANASIDIEKYTKVQVPGGADVCAALGGRPTELTFLYTGDDPPVSPGIFGNGNSQGKFAFTVNGATGSQDVKVVVGSGLVANPTTVKVGESFTVKTTSGGTMAASTNIKLTSLGGTVLEDMTVHTSCSSPLLLGDQFLSLNLIGGVGAKGSITLPSGSDLGEDADTPTGPEAIVGSTVTWNYVVTNTGQTVLVNLTVTDDHAPGVVPVFVKVMTGDADGLFEPGEVWLYSASGTAVAGQYANVGTAVGTPADAAGVPYGIPNVTDADPSHYFGKLPDVDVCATYGKPQQLVMKYLGNLDNDNTQAAGKTALLGGGDPSGATSVHIVVTDSSTEGAGHVFFDGIVASPGETFTIDATATGRLGAQTYVYIYSSGGALLEKMTFHTSCSQPLDIGDTFYGLELVGFWGSGTGNGIGVPPTLPPIPTCAMTATKWEVKDRQVKITIQNSGNVDSFLTSLTDIQWPSVNGMLKKVKLDKDTVYDKPDIAWSSGGVGSLTLVTDQNKRKIGKNSSDTIVLEFEKNAVSDLSQYTATAAFSTCTTPLTLLPH